MADWLPHDLLLKLDRCLMAHGVEGRTPFLDPGVAAAAFRLPDGLKVQRRPGQVAAAPVAGAGAAGRRTRLRPSRASPCRWVRGSPGRGRGWGRWWRAQPGVAEIAEPDRVIALFRNAAGRRESFAAWTLLFYALWHRAHIEGQPTDGDVFATLAAH